MGVPDQLETVGVLYTFDYEGLTTTVHDPKGNVYVYQFNGTGLCVNAQLPSCQYPMLYEYEGYNLKKLTQEKLVYDPVAKIDNLQDVVTEYTYAANGNL